MKNIKEIKEFNISKAENGYVVKISYEVLPKPEMIWAPSEYATLIAKDITELSSFIDSWFSRVV